MAFSNIKRTNETAEIVKNDTERQSLCYAVKNELAVIQDNFDRFCRDIPEETRLRHFPQLHRRKGELQAKIKTAFTYITNRMPVFDLLNQYFDHATLVRNLSFDDFNCPIYNADLYLTDKTDLKELPSSFTVQGTLDLKGTGLKQLPRNLIVYGTLNISYTDITELPSDFYCRSLCCSGKLKKQAETAAGIGCIGEKKIIYNG